ncbi:MAG: outer membrane protein assembly factor BamD [Desulfuromonadales bacterium]|nr:outer membrane protein assembly factor BamD [Desulfuromonadales bacterium]MDT8423403.1 outer membrane protein assembly factor BamD [Desulfuromonadales bacterium]
MRLFIIPLCCFILAACMATEVPERKSADQYFKQGEEFLENNQYEDAIASWEKVRDSYQSPELVTIAELKIAETHFLAEQYPEAVAAWEAFLKQHPNYPQAAEVIFQLGKAYYIQMLSADRDQTATHNAIATFETLLRQYPESSHSAEARQLNELCHNRLAEHELYVGEVYLRLEQYPAAIRRLSGLLESYPNYQENLDKALFLLAKAYLLNEQRAEATDYFNLLYRNFPDSPYVLKGRKLVEKHY